MALITVSGEPGCRAEKVARLAAQRLGWDLIAEAQMLQMIQDEFGSSPIPSRAIGYLALSIVARLALRHHIVTTAAATERLTPKHFPGLIRVWITAPVAWRVGSLMVDRRIDRLAARGVLLDLDRSQKAERKLRSGRVVPLPTDYDITLNASTAESDQIAALIEKAVGALAVTEPGLLAPGAEAQIQFEVRLELAKHGISPPDRVTLKRAAFVHPSEEIFANLLDFYRISWEYEPRSFPIQWDKNGRVLEAFTPDFYLPEFDLYVELTTMKQAHVTKKNRKIKLLRTIYPDVNIQVFYQKDFQDLIFKHGLAERPVEV